MCDKANRVNVLYIYKKVLSNSLTNQAMLDSNNLVKMAKLR